VKKSYRRLLHGPSVLLRVSAEHDRECPRHGAPVHVRPLAAARRGGCPRGERDRHCAAGRAGPSGIQMGRATCSPQRTSSSGGT